MANTNEQQELTLTLTVATAAGTKQVGTLRTAYGREQARYGRARDEELALAYDLERMFPEPPAPDSEQWPGPGSRDLAPLVVETNRCARQSSKGTGQLAPCSVREWCCRAPGALRLDTEQERDGSVVARYVHIPGRANPVRAGRVVAVMKHLNAAGVTTVSVDGFYKALELVPWDKEPAQGWL